MEFINLKSLNLTAEEYEDLIKLLAQKRGITTKELLSTIKLNLKRKNKKDLASKSQQKKNKIYKITAKISKNAIRVNKITTKINKIYKKTTKINKTDKITKRIN